MKMYFIAVVLPQDLNEKIIVHKNFMHERFGCAVGLKSPAHITIVPPFWMDEEKEKHLIDDIDSISNNVNSFPLATNNFSAFKPRTIFIDVQPSQQLNELKTLSETFFSDKEYKMKRETRAFHPHITIATRDLYKKDFAEAWPLFAEREFQESWLAQGLSLLKHNGRSWDVVHIARFK